jgi:hypothetical protein
MNSMNDTGVVAGPASDRTSRTHRLRDLVGPPLLSGASTATTTALLGLHLVPATVMIPTLARSLRNRAPRSRSPWETPPVARLVTWELEKAQCRASYSSIARPSSANFSVRLTAGVTGGFAGRFGSM